MSEFAAVDRNEATQILRNSLSDELVVAGLGNPAYDLFLAGDRPEHFYMWGALGLAGSVGLGVALAAPRSRVIVLDGDGALLMNLGSLATIGMMRPPNYVLIVWDNRSFDLTGGQKTHTAYGVSLAGMGKAAGIEKSVQISTLQEFQEIVPRLLSEEGPWLVVISAAPTSKQRKKPLIGLRRRFLHIESITDKALEQNG